MLDGEAFLSELDRTKLASSSGHVPVGVTFGMICRGIEPAAMIDQELEREFRPRKISSGAPVCEADCRVTCFLFHRPAPGAFSVSCSRVSRIRRETLD